jgi:uncharacterized protein YfiM (DUF2279 family)
LILCIICSILLSNEPIYAGKISPALKSYLKSFEKAQNLKHTDRWLSPDKGYHAMGSMISTTFIGQISKNGFGNSTEQSKIIGAGTTFALGLAKEIYDSGKTKNYFSWKDLTANGVGIIIGVLLLGIK